MGIFRRNRLTEMSDDRHAAVAVAPQAVLVSASPSTAPETVIEASLNDSNDESDVFVCRRSSPPAPENAVTLFVFGWHNVEPGPLSWPFPSLRTALDAVRTMRNAAQWCICSGNTWTSLEAARSAGAVLIEQLI